MLSISSPNQQIFDHLYQQKSLLEKGFGFPLSWERMEGSKACRIESRMKADLFDRAGWDNMIREMTERTVKLEQTFSPALAEILVDS